MLIYFNVLTVSIAISGLNHYFLAEYFYQCFQYDA